MTKSQTRGGWKRETDAEDAENPQNMALVWTYGQGEDRLEDPQ